MQQLIFLQDMAVVMAISAVIMIFCHRISVPVVLGYIIAGLLIGPNTPPYSLVKDLHSIHILAELGVIFLLFSIGLEFSFTRLAKVGAVAFVAATVEIALMLLIGFFLGKAFGWNYMNSLFLGAILSISSTTIIAKVLMDTKKIKEKFAQVILGILIIEDLLAIIIIAVLSGIATTGSFAFAEVAFAMGKVIGFIAGILFFGFLLVPRLLKYIEKFESSEMMVITVLGLCFGVSLLAAKAGFSVALGAFLIGAIIAETKQVKEVIHKMEPIRDMFTALFFVSVGMLLSLKTLQEYALVIVIITLVTIFGKIFSCSVATFLTGYNARTSLKVGLGLAQIGEFSFIIALLGESTKVTSPFLYPIAVAVSGITALTTPLLMSQDSKISDVLARLVPKPLVTASSLYTGWFERAAKDRNQKSTISKKLKPYIPRLLFYSFGLVSAMTVIFYFIDRAPFLPVIAYWILAVLAVMPFIHGATDTLERLLWTVFHGRSENESLQVKATLQKALRFLVTLLMSLIFFLVGIFYWPLWALNVVVLVLLLISGLPLWDSISKAHQGIEKIALQVFDQQSSDGDSKGQDMHRELVKLIRNEYPLNVVTEDFMLPLGESAVNQSLRDLGLRSHSGATVVSIYRGDESIPNPLPETVLMPGDVLMLMGEPEQIRAASKYLYDLAKKKPVIPIRREGAPKTTVFEIPKNSPLLGKTLSEIKLRRNTGATVLKIQKEDLSLSNPGADTNLEEGDMLTLLGWQDQLDLAIEYLKKTE